MTWIPVSMSLRRLKSTRYRFRDAYSLLRQEMVINLIKRMSIIRSIQFVLAKSDWFKVLVTNIESHYISWNVNELDSKMKSGFYIKTEQSIDQSHVKKGIQYYLSILFCIAFYNHGTVLILSTWAQIPTIVLGNKITWMISHYNYIRVFSKCFSLNMLNWVTKICHSVKGLEPATQPPLV